ncbi:MAG: transport-associated protein [Acidobacteriales bacterium]|nr:transport-associated protein [Terriglobales bacterium]
MKNMSSSSLLAFLVAISCMLSGGCNKSANAPARADAQVATDVQAKINSDSNVPTKAITVNANNGVVTLSGAVGSEMERQAASNDAAQVDGVKTVVNNLTATSASNMPASDAIGSSAATNNQAPSSNREPSSAMRASTSKGNRVRTAPMHAAPAAAAANSSANTLAANREPSSALAPATPAVTTINVPSGTSFSVRTIDALSSEKAQAGDTFTATLDTPIDVNGQVVIPANSDVQGKVVEAKNASKFTGSSQLTLELTKVSFNGKSYRIKTDQWARTGTARGKNTAAKVGGGAALGAIIGGIAGGGKGAAIGAGVGAGAGTGAQAITHGEQIVLNPETLLTFQLKSPVTVTPSSSMQNPNRKRLGSGDSNQ